MTLLNEITEPALKVRRQELALTQSQVCAWTQGRVQQSQLSNYERGLAVPEHHRQLLATALETTEAKLFDLVR